jgi:hypothetical protein
MLAIAFRTKKAFVMLDRRKNAFVHRRLLGCRFRQKRLATPWRSFSFRAMLAQKLDDLLIALFLRLIQRRFPVDVLRVHVRFLI